MISYIVIVALSYGFGRLTGTIYRKRLQIKIKQLTK